MLPSSDCKTRLERALGREYLGCYLFQPVGLLGCIGLNRVKNAILHAKMVKCCLFHVPQLKIFTRDWGSLGTMVLQTAMYYSLAALRRK